MPTPVETFLANSPPSIDDVREEAARCCEETAKCERGERGPLRTPLTHGPLVAEFSDGAFGVAGELADVVLGAFIGAGLRGKFRPAQGWDIAARLLRSGWNRGDRLEGWVVGKGKPS